MSRGLGDVYKRQLSPLSLALIVSSSSLLASGGEGASTSSATNEVCFGPCLLRDLFLSNGSLTLVGPGCPHSCVTVRAAVSCESWVKQSPGPSQARRGQGSALPGLSPCPGAVVARREGVTCLSPILSQAHRKHTLKLCYPPRDRTPPTESLRILSISVSLGSVPTLPTS